LITGEIFVSDKTSVHELAVLLGQKPFKIITDLMRLGVFATAKQEVDFESVSKVLRAYGYAAKRKA
jgi:hypothetical protein